MDTLQFANPAEQYEWREMVRMFLERGMTDGQALAAADGYIKALRERSQGLAAFAAKS